MKIDPNDSIAFNRAVDVARNNDIDRYLDRRSELEREPEYEECSNCNGTGKSELPALNKGKIAYNTCYLCNGKGKVEVER